MEEIGFANSNLNEYNNNNPDMSSCWYPLKKNGLEHKKIIRQFLYNKMNLLKMCCKYNCYIVCKWNEILLVFKRFLHKYVLYM